MASAHNPVDIQKLYRNFDAAITSLDCGRKCAPYNEKGVPFCCDTNHIVPAAYLSEWSYYQSTTDLWHTWNPQDEQEYSRLAAVLPENMILLECLGHLSCQRNFRSIACRSFPFYPYLDQKKEFIGLTYYWEYQDLCWVISNLDVVSDTFRDQCIQTFTDIFATYPDEVENYAYFSTQMRQEFARQNRAIYLLHRDGNIYPLSPKNESMSVCLPKELPKYGPYEVAAFLRFPDEV